MDFKDAFNRQQSANRDAKLEKFKEYIDAAIASEIQSLREAMLTLLAPTLTRLSVVENLAKEHFGLNDDAMKELFWDHEDQALRLTKSEEPAAAGDHLRVLIQEGTTPPQERLVYINSLCGATPALVGTLEKELVGAKVGETREVNIPGLDFKVQMIVRRICKRPAPPKLTVVTAPEEGASK